MTIMLTRRQAGQSLVAATFAGQSGDAGGQELYAITGCPQPHTASAFPAVLFCLGARVNRVRWAAELSVSGRGVDYVLYSYENHVAVVASPKSNPNQIVVIPFHSPTQLRSVRLDLDGYSVVRRHLVWLENELSLALALFRDGRRRFAALGLERMKMREFSPEALYSSFAIDGVVGGVVANDDSAFLEQHAGSDRLFVGETMPRFPSSVRVPKQIVFPASEIVSLVAANKEVLVLTSGKARLRKGPEGTTPLKIFERKRGLWHPVDVPGGGSGVRAFGNYLAVNVREIRETFVPSPGTRDRQEPSPTGPPFDWEAKSLSVYMPGLVYLYHVPTRRRIVEETRQGDTEVLWVKDERVLYRCDQTLYEARIEGTRLLDRRKLIERDFIRDVHWVFYGPPSPQPPGPPYPTFRAYEE